MQLNCWVFSRHFICELEWETANFNCQKKKPPSETGLKEEKHTSLTAYVSNSESVAKAIQATNGLDACKQAIGGRIPLIASPIIELESENFDSLQSWSDQTATTLLLL